ncbi:hypothetical protein [uncultured Desulfosarcina sp.]|uniref:hypothetical protein n=1 Tax=uncultured Desulfosarcina sp. TaxID=218289 RepID=UPI0029C84F58|nr:hypothetical protein [uncultured Desulfosarcina sp.]
MEQYLTTEELSERIKMPPGSIRNLIWKEELKLNIHYVKPTPRKILFVWSAIEKWLWGGRKPGMGKQPRSLINV